MSHGGGIADEKEQNKTFYRCARKRHCRDGDVEYARGKTKQTRAAREVGECEVNGDDADDVAAGGGLAKRERRAKQQQHSCDSRPACLLAGWPAG